MNGNVVVLMDACFGEETAPIDGVIDDVVFVEDCDDGRTMTSVDVGAVGGRGEACEVESDVVVGLLEGV